jgi:Na+/H+ antiporter
LIFAILLASLLIALAAKRLGQPYPIALVIGGLCLAAIPGIPNITLDPNVVFYILLPPVLFEAAYFTSWRDLMAQRRPVLMLAFGLVAASSVAVGAVCVWLIPGMNWATGITLGAIISPPDAAAATAITRGLRLPRQIVQIIEGESLVNDASALTIYRFAVAAIVTGSFLWSRALLTFFWIALGGAAIGVGIGYAYVWLFPKIKDSEVEILSTFALAYGSYIAAEEVHASGVLACVASGLILGRSSPNLFTAAGRIRGAAVWATAIFLTNVVIFALIGLQLPAVLADLRGYPTGMLIGWCAAVSATVIVVRIVWVYLVSPCRNGLFVVAWTGLRGVVSLAAALALPLETATGLPFPYRSLLLLLTFTVILVTLLLQGLTLRPIIRWLRLPEDRSGEEEALEARIRAAEAALDRLSELENSAPEHVVQRVRGFFTDRLADSRVQQELAVGGEEVERPEEFQSLSEQRLWFELLRAERATIIAMRRDKKIGDEALHEIEHELDLLEARLTPR